MESLISFDEGLEVLPTRKVDTHRREPFLDLREISISAADTEDELIKDLSLFPLWQLQPSLYELPHLICFLCRLTVEGIIIGQQLCLRWNIIGLSSLTFQERMVSVQPISNERDIYDLPVQDIFEFPIHIEFVKSQDIVVLALMPGNFRKCQEFVPRHQFWALRGDDLICFPKGNDPIEVSHRIEVLPQLS